MSCEKAALVTGSGKHRVGNAIARRLAQSGYRVALHYFQSKYEAELTLEEIRGLGVDAMSVRADLRDELAVGRMAELVLDRFGRVDLLVNSAAVWICKTFREVNAADLLLHFEVNTLGSFVCAQKIGLAMVNQPDGGSIVNIGDWAIERPYRGYAAYFPSKGAIPAMTRSLAVELGTLNPKVRVNCVLPGPVMLPPEIGTEEREAIIGSTLVKREGSPEHVAQAVLFLAENEFVTGTSLTVDGGRTVYAGEEGRGSAGSPEMPNRATPDGVGTPSGARDRG